jgi:hypothetical protein
MISRRGRSTPAACDAGTVRDDQVSRRRVLSAAAGLGATLLVTSACSSQSSADRQPTATPSIGPDVGIREGAAEAERALLAAYAATIARHPELTERLAAPSAHHEEHLSALSPLSPPATPTPTVSAPASSPAAGGAGVSSGVPDDPLAAVAALATAERVAAGRQLEYLGAASPGLARLLASVGAAEAAHAAVLGS